MSDPFETLGVARDATDAQIKAAYRKLAMEFHPDKNPGDKAAEERFKAISAANDILKDPLKKAEALSPGARGFANAGPRGGFNPGGFRAGGFEFRFEHDGHEPGQFRAHMHPGAGGRPFSPHPPQNQHYTVLTVISLEDALKGKAIDVQVATLHGEKFVQVQVPAGADNGMRLRVAGHGDSRVQNAPPGDLFVTIRVADHPEFLRVAQTLYTSRTIDAFDAMLGTQIEVKTLDARIVQVNVPPGIHSGQQLRVSGHGMPILGQGGVRGHLIVEIDVSMPVLNETQKAHVLAAKAAVVDPTAVDPTAD